MGNLWPSVMQNVEYSKETYGIEADIISLVHKMDLELRQMV